MLRGSRQLVTDEEVGRVASLLRGSYEELVPVEFGLKWVETFCRRWQNCRNNTMALWENSSNRRPNVFTSETLCRAG